MIILNLSLFREDMWFSLCLIAGQIARPFLSLYDFPARTSSESVAQNKNHTEDVGSTDDFYSLKDTRNVNIDRLSQDNCHCIWIIWFSWQLFSYCYIDFLDVWIMLGVKFRSIQRYSSRRRRCIYYVKLLIWNLGFVTMCSFKLEEKHSKSILLGHNKYFVCTLHNRYVIFLPSKNFFAIFLAENVKIERKWYTLKSELIVAALVQCSI